MSVTYYYFFFNLIFMKYAVIAPAFHNSYLEAMVKIFTACSERTILKFNKLLEGKGYDGSNLIELDLEAEFSSLALDIIGLGVFNYDFGSVTKESPVIKVWLKGYAFQVYIDVALIVNESKHAAFLSYILPLKSV